MPRSRVKVHGVKDLRAAIRRAPPELREEILEEVDTSTKNMLSDARRKLATASSFAAFWHGQTGMQNITGQFRRFYRRSVSKKRLSGRVGLLSSRANSKAFYVRFFNDGTENQPARPFHDEAFENEEDDYIRRQKVALQRVLAKIFK